MGRITKVTFEQLKLKTDSRARLEIADSMQDIGKGFAKAGDDRGHLIGDRFNGDNSLANIVAMDGKINKGEYKKIENLWAKTIEEGKNISGTIELTYSAESFRPYQFNVLYDIGEGIVEKVLMN